MPPCRAARPTSAGSSRPCSSSMASRSSSTPTWQARGEPRGPVPRPNGAPGAGRRDRGAATGVGRGGLRVTVAPGAGEGSTAARRSGSTPSRSSRPRLRRSSSRSSCRAAWASTSGRIARSSTRPCGLQRRPGAADLRLGRHAARGLARQRLRRIGRTLFTPPADGRILPGITRARALALPPRPASKCAKQSSARGLSRGRRGVPDRLAAGRRASPDPGRDRAEKPTVKVTAHIAGELRRAWVHGGLDRVPRR